MKLSVKHHQGLPFYHRPNSSDETAFREVVEKQCYRRHKINFYPYPGEHWLDLGANVGAFTLWCVSRGVTRVTCYEPDRVCYNILRRNLVAYQGNIVDGNIAQGDIAPRVTSSAVTLSATRAAVTVSKSPTVELWPSADPRVHYRNSIFQKGRCAKEPVLVPNVYAGELASQRFDGVKMDIEGAELAMIDEWLIPKCNKLCLEYHSSRDKDLDNLKRRLDILKSRFKVVKYQDYDNAILHNDLNRYAPYDRVVFCMDPV